MKHTFKMRPLSSPTTRGSAIFLGPVMGGISFYFVSFIYDSDLFLTAFLSIFGLLFFIASIILTFGYMELAIDTEKNTWTEQLNIFNLRLAPTVQAIPEALNYILIFDSDYTFSNPNDDIKIDSIDFYEVSVIYDERRKQVFTLCTQHEKALAIAKKIRSIFDLEIVDKTTGGVQY